MGDVDGPCRISVDLREVNEHPIHELRLLLVADVLRRFVEVLQGREVVLAVLGQQSTSAAEVRGLGIRDPEARPGSPEEVAVVLGGPPTFLLEPVRLRPSDGRERVSQTMQIGVVRPPRHVEDALVSVLGEHDPAALRLVLLRFSPTRSAALSAARLHRAEETVRRGRYKVAMWADMPSSSAARKVVSAARDALDEGLNTVTVLKDLHRLEVEPRVESGSKFTTFAYLDRVLGLDLCHLVGRLHR